VAGLPHSGRFDCLTEPGIVHQAVAGLFAKKPCSYGATAWWYEAREGVSKRPEWGKPTMRTNQPWKSGLKPSRSL